MTDIEQIAHEVCDNVTDLAEVFNNSPWRRKEFGDRELAGLREASLKLSLLLSAIETPVRVAQAFALDTKAERGASNVFELARELKVYLR